MYSAGARSNSSVCVTPAALVPCMVLSDEESCACAKGIKVLKRAKEEINAVAHDADDNEGKRAIVEMVVLVYRVVE